MKSNNHFYIKIKVKPYVKQYLLNEYSLINGIGDKVISFKKDAELNFMFKSIMSKKTTRYDKRYKDLSARYSEEVQVLVSYDEGVRHGWEISQTDIVRLGKILETRAKKMLFSYLDTFRSIGRPLSESIDAFQREANYPDSVWSADTIRREYNRHGGADKGIAIHLYGKINELILGNLSVNRTTE